MRDFFAHIRRERKNVLTENGGAEDFCRKLLIGQEQSSLLGKLGKLLAATEPDERDYAITTAYSLLIGEKMGNYTTVIY